MFNPDQPIKSKKEDVLGRDQFAKSLGDAILSYNEKDSLVIGLFGAWGSGKTSIINMAVEHIEDVASKNRTDAKPIVIKFNPWNFSDQNQLIIQFFKQLSTVLKRQDGTGAKKAGKKMETYAKCISPFALLPNVAPFASIISGVFKITGCAAKSYGNLKSSDLNTIREELNKLLEKQAHKIIVVIDDVDRLNNTEIRQIFQLVKSLGNFSNTIYLLAFDRDVVINALTKVQEGSGAEYLEKVVQVPFEMPLIPKSYTEHLLFSQLNKLLKDIPKNGVDQTYWRDIYQGGLKHFFRNIRDVNRYINSLRFSFDMVKGEVNAVDLFAITGIQVFMPEVYYGIRDNKDIFSGAADSSYSINKDALNKQAKKRCDEIIGRADDDLQEVLKDFLKIIFPKLDILYYNINYGSDSMNNWRRDSRICSPDIFDTYFMLSLPEGEISKKEIETILSLGNDPLSFAEALLKLNEDGRIMMFLNRLEDYTRSDIPKENIENIITVLMDIGDLFPEGDTEFFGIDTLMGILRISNQLSHRFDSPDRRFRIYKRAIEKSTKSLHTIVFAVGVQGQQHGKYTYDNNPEPVEKQTVNAVQLEKLETLACRKIENWAEDGRLAKHRHLMYILFRWSEWGEKDKITNFIKNMIKNDDGLIDFIAAFLNKHTAYGVSKVEISWVIDIKEIKPFVDLKEVGPRMRKLLSSPHFEALDNQKKIGIKRFLDTMNGKILKKRGCSA